MLHLYPIRVVLTCVISLAALSVVGATYMGWSPEGWSTIAKIVRISGSAALAMVVGLYLVWRTVPFVQNAIFPYLGGGWSGIISYSGDRGNGTKPVRLSVRHNALKLQLVLDSDESTSTTLVVHAERDDAAMRRRLYYVYRNERKEGYPGAGQAYKGVAIMRVENNGGLELYGNYFAEGGQRGELELARTHSNPLWKFWA